MKINVKIGITLSVFFMVIATINAQKITLKGVVKDSLQNYLPYTNIIAKPESSVKNLDFTITNEKGQYKLTLEKGVKYSINLTHMGYETVNFYITATKNTTKNFTLKEVKNQLDEVVIELPVIVKKDTIIYDTKQFVNGTERKLKNVLKKLPGVDVDKNGSVTVQGKKVTKLLVDGKPFFNGGTKLGVENIPADAVDKVEILDNYNEVAFLKELSDSDEMALNVQLKEDKKNFVFGDVEAGKGNDPFYSIGANLFYYSPKTTLNFIGNSNTLGKKTFTFKDYLNFQGGFNAVFSDNFDFKGGDFSQFMESTNILQSNEQFGALNLNNTVSINLDISGYAIFSNTNTNSFQTNQNQYISFTELQENETDAKNTLGIGKLVFDYSPNSKEQWYFKTQVKRNNNSTKNEILSTVDLNTNTIFTETKDVATNINQNIEWHYNHSYRHTFSAIATYTFDKNNPETLWQTSLPILQGLLTLVENENRTIIKQHKQTTQHNFSTIFKEFWLLNSNNHIYTTFGNTYQQQFFSNDDYQVLDDNTQHRFISDGFNNDVGYTMHDFFVGVHYKFRSGIFTLKQGVYLHHYDWNVQQGTNFELKKWILLPDFKAKIEFNKSKKIRIGYNLKTNFASVDKLANRFYLQTYNSAFRGDETLENELFHSLSISYSRFSLYRGLMLHANANYTKKIIGFQNAVAFEDVNNYLTYQLINNPSENYRLGLGLSKRIRKIKYKVDASYDASNFIQQIDAVVENNSNKNYAVALGAETLYENFPRLEFGYRRAIGDYTTGETSSKFITNEPFFNIEYNFLKDFVLKSDYIYYNYQNKTQSLKNSYQIANASLLYQKEDSPWTYEIIAQNLCNTVFKQSNSFFDYLISDTRTYIMPRAIVFSIGYKL